VAQRQRIGLKVYRFYVPAALYNVHVAFPQSAPRPAGNHLNFVDQAAILQKGFNEFKAVRAESERAHGR